MAKRPRHQRRRRRPADLLRDLPDRGRTPRCHVPRPRPPRRACSPRSRSTSSASTRHVGESSIDDFLRWLQADDERSAIPVLFLLPPGSQLAAAAASHRSCGRAWTAIYEAAGRGRPQKEMVRALALARARRPAHPRILRLPPLALDRDTHDLSAGGRTVHLTPTEYRLVSYLMERPGEVVAGDELLERVWGFHPGTGSAAVVRVHVGNLRRKMAQIGAGRLLETLPHRGYRLRVEGAPESRDR